MPERVPYYVTDKNSWFSFEDQKFLLDNLILKYNTPVKIIEVGTTVVVGYCN